MSNTSKHGIDIEAILTDLYNSEINASISWVWNGGFDAFLGEPPHIEGLAFPTIVGAVAWLRDRACEIYPDSDFARKYGPTR